MTKKYKCVGVNKHANGTAQLTFHELIPDAKNEKIELSSIITIHFVNAKEVDDFLHLEEYEIAITLIRK